MTRPWAQRAQGLFASHKFGKAVQNDLHLSEPSALVKGPAKERNDIAQKESPALEGAKAGLPVCLVWDGDGSTGSGAIKSSNRTNCQSTQVEVERCQNVKPGTYRHRALSSNPPIDPKAPVVALMGAWFFSPAARPYTQYQKGPPLFSGRRKGQMPNSGGP